MIDTTLLFRKDFIPFENNGVESCTTEKNDKDKEYNYHKKDKDKIPVGDGTFILILFVLLYTIKKLKIWN